MKKNTSVGTMLAKLFQKLAPKIGAKVVIEPKWGIVGQITFKNGRKRYFRGSTIDMNPVGASDIAKDKGWATFFMNRMGYPTIPGKTFFSNEHCRRIKSRDNIDAAYRYAKHIGFPVIVKPNSGSQGNGVAKVYAKQEFYRAMKFIFKQDRVALVQTPVEGQDYRIVVLDDKVISAYQRVPLSVIGDGNATVRQLLQRKQKQFVASGRDTKIQIEDKRIAEKLKRQGLTMNSKIPHARLIYLLDNANLSAGGDAIDVTDSFSGQLKKEVVRLTYDMGLRICGVDLMINEEAGNWRILEINAAPGLDHYAKAGKAQAKIVEDMYLEVLKAMQ